jgi:hypothetical protein
VPNHLRDTRIRVSFVARPLLTPVARKLCGCEHDVFTSRMCVHSRILFRIEIAAAVREAFNNSYPEIYIYIYTVIIVV